MHTIEVYSVNTVWPLLEDIKICAGRKGRASSSDPIDVPCRPARCSRSSADSGRRRCHLRLQLTVGWCSFAR
jgi:hypothetical protein